VVTPSGLLEARLRNQCLRATPHRTPQQVVSWLGAVQAQDYPGAAWALALRAAGLTLADVDRALASGRILRTHVLRPTWHLVAPADIRWMLALTGPRVQALMRGYDRRLELDARVYTRARTLIERALAGGRALTRAELSQVLRRGGIEATGQRLAHLVMHAELEGAICSGPRLGAHFTYALLAERAPTARTLPRDEALAALAVRYFRSHGPATVRDFAWWSGLTMADARAAAGEAAGHGEVLAEAPSLQRAPGAHFLLPNYDEYLIAYRDRGAVLDPARARNLGMFTSLEYPHQVVVEGRVAGSWKRSVTRASAQVSVRWYRAPAARQRAAVAAEAARFGRFLGLACGVHHGAPAR
jgi:hypothetical protein